MMKKKSKHKKNIASMISVLNTMLYLHTHYQKLANFCIAYEILKNKNFRPGIVELFIMFLVRVRSANFIIKKIL